MRRRARARPGIERRRRMAEAKSQRPRTNAPPPAATGGNPARPSNAGLMRGASGPERYSAGFPIHNQVKVNAALALLNLDLRKQAADIERSLAAGDSLPWLKLGGEEREPEVDRHQSSPDQAMRPRSEIILFDQAGVWCQDKGDYILFPGGGVDDGEQPRDAAIRETIEESNHHPVNVEPHGVVEAVWPKGQNDFWDTSDFDGERTYFFLGLDAGEAGITHSDLEDFEHCSFGQIEERLRELIDNPDQAWARRNNQERLRLVQRARRLCATRDGCRPRKQASFDQLPGGAADGMPDSAFPADELEEATEHELEHVNDAALAKEIGKDHLAEELAEGPKSEVDYYEDVERMEDQDRAEVAMAKESMAGPQHPATGGQTAPMPPSAPVDPAAQSPQQPAVAQGGIQPVAQDPQSPVTGMPRDRNAVFMAQLAKRLAPQQPQQAAMQPTPQTAEPPEQEGVQKAADAASFLRRRQRLMITPDGKLVVRRLPGRRFALPEGAGGVDAPYEKTVRYIPTGGVPEEGFHGYEYALGLDEADEVPEGFEGLDPNDVLRDLYASMGKPENREWRDIDRQRARVLLRLLKRRASV